MHETGHALYEFGLPKSLKNQLIGKSAGMSLHESQSLFIEMQITKTKEFKDRLKNIFMEKYGVDWYSKSKEFKEKFKISSIEKYGVTHPMLNEDFKKIYSLGSAAAISQPPLVIIPKITSDAPNVSNTQKNLNSQINRPAQKPLVAQKKRLDAAKFSHIVSILDAKGTDQLHRCLRKISHKDKQNYFANFSEELSALEELSTTNKRKSLSIRDLVVNSPSKDQCINYLDFILMAG